MHVLPFAFQATLTTEPEEMLLGRFHNRGVIKKKKKRGTSNQWCSAAKCIWAK